MRTPTPMEEEVTAAGESYIVTNLINVTLHQIYQGIQIKENKMHRGSFTHTGDYKHIQQSGQNDSKKDYCHIGCENMQYGRYVPTLQRHLRSSSAGYIQRWYTRTRLCGITSCKKVSIVSNAKTANLRNKGKTILKTKHTWEENN